VVIAHRSAVLRIGVIPQVTTVISEFFGTLAQCLSALPRHFRGAVPDDKSDIGSHLVTLCSNTPVMRHWAGVLITMAVAVTCRARRMLQMRAGRRRLDIRPPAFPSTPSHPFGSEIGIYFISYRIHENRQ
jgi:hypothetical protein